MYAAQARSCILHLCVGDTRQSVESTITSVTGQWPFMAKCNMVSWHEYGPQFTVEHFWLD